MNALDSVIQCLINGGDVRVVVVPDDRGPCHWPLYTPETGYNKGCRCDRCRGGHNATSSAWGKAKRARQAAQRRAFQRIQWERRQ